MIRLIASDIDGTLLQNGGTAIAPAVFDHIHRLREAGILFCPASGRQYSSLRRLFAPVADELTYLCENGAVVYGPGSPGEVLSKTVMDRADSLELCREILAIPQCEVLISGENTSYLCPKQGDMVELIRDFVGNNVALLAAPEEMPEDFVKISAYCRNGPVEIFRRLAPRWGAFHPAVAGERWLDFTLADKGAGLRGLCASLGIPLEEVMAFGDNYNDLPMLELVGHPWLMEGAAAELKARFPRRCARVEQVLATLP